MRAIQTCLKFGNLDPLARLERIFRRIMSEFRNGLLSETPNPWHDWRVNGKTRPIERARAVDRTPSFGTGPLRGPIEPDELSDILENPKLDVYIKAGGEIELNYHNQVHRHTGGWLMSRDSPADPLFFLLHANVDRGFAHWQERHDAWDTTGSEAGSYHAIGSYPGSGADYLEGSYALDKMWPWSNTERSGIIFVMPDELTGPASVPTPARWRTHNFVDFTFIFDTLQKNSRQENSMARSDMRDFEWDFIEKLLPNKSRGVKRVDDRRVINGILYALRTGIPWRDMPEQYGPWSTIYNRFNRWSKAGIWDMIFEAIVDSHNVDTVMVDSTSVRAHPTAAKLKKTDKRRCLGRSRGGLGTKIHASNNQDGLPLKLELTPNQANDAPPCETLLTGLQPGQWVLADKAYDVNWIRDMIWEQGAIDVIPSKSNRKIPKEFDKVMYRQRNKIERFFGRLKASFRRIATRYEHTSANFLAMIKLACVRLWLEFYEYAA